MRPPRSARSAFGVDGVLQVLGVRRGAVHRRTEKVLPLDYLLQLLLVLLAPQGHPIQVLLGLGDSRTEFRKVGDRIDGHDINFYLVCHRLVGCVVGFILHLDELALGRAVRGEGMVDNLVQGPYRPVEGVEVPE